MEKYFKNKNIIIAAITIILIVLLGLLIFRDASEDNNVNKIKKQEMIEITDPEIMKQVKVDGIDFLPKLFVVQDGKSRVIIEVTNNTEEDYSLQQYIVKVKDKDNQILGTMHGYIGDEIKAGEARSLDVSIDRDLSKVATIEYEVEK